MSSVKKKRGSWSENNLKAAITAIQTEHLTQRAAAEKYHIPRRTLRNHLKSGVFSRVIGKQTTLTKGQEHELCQRIKRFAEIGLPLTPKFIRKQAYLFCEKFEIQHKFNHEKEMAGPDWLRLFLKRNPSISKRKPQIMNPARAQKLNRPIVQHHFQEVQKLYEELNILEHPERLYNMDEKGCRITVHHQNTVLAAKGSKRVHLIAPEHAENVTIAMCVNATGTTIPPMIIFKGQRNNPELAANLPAGTLVRMAKKGSMTHDLFVEFIQHLGRHKVPGKCLLVFDGAKCHMSYEAVQEAEKNDIVLYCLPSNTTHELQPLDKSVNKSYEHYWDEEVLRVLYNKPDAKLTKATFNKMFSNTWPKCMTYTNIVNGFKATGLFPFNPEAIPVEAYGPSILTEIPFVPDKDGENFLLCQNQLSSDKNSISPQQSQTNRFSASSIIQSMKSLNDHPTLVDYSSSNDESENETDKRIHFPEKENYVSPSILQDLPCSTKAKIRHGDGIMNQYDDAVPSCSGLQKPVLNVDTDTSDSDSSNLFVRKPSEKCFARDLYSFSSDDTACHDNIDHSINKGDTTPKDPLKFTTRDTKASNKDPYHSGTSSNSEDDNVPISIINKQNSSFHELMPTPNYAKTKSEQPRKKAINYKGVKVTKDLFKECDEKLNRSENKSVKTSKKKQQMKTEERKECKKYIKDKKQITTKINTKTKSHNKRPEKVQETKASKKQYGDDNGNDNDKWYCYACFEEKIEDMRGCMLCNKWYHEVCVGLTKADKEFICSNCD